MEREPAAPAESLFDRGTALEMVGDGRYRAHVDPRWNVGAAPNGGYLLAIAVAAIERTLPHPDPFALTAHYTTRTVSGSDLDVDVEPVRAGRAHSTAVARLRQGDQVRVHVTGTFGDLSTMDGPTVVQAERPAIPPPEQCIRAEGPSVPEFVRQFDTRLVPESVMWAVGQPTGVAVLEGWTRFADGRSPDARSLALFADAFPPPVVNLFPILWVPTLELTVHVRGRPAPGWLQCRFRTRYVIQGYLEEDGEIWDERGLVALSRQLARVQAAPSSAAGPRSAGGASSER